MKSNWKVIVAFAGIFIAGAVTGTFLGVRVIHYFDPKPIAADQFWAEELKKFTVGLDLTADQSAKIAPILQQTAEDWKKARRDAFKATSVVFDNMYASIAKELTDAQRVRLTEMQAKDREHHPKWVTGRPKPHGDTPPRHGQPPSAPGQDANPNHTPPATP